MTDGPSPAVVDAVTRAAKRAPSSWARSVGGGYTPAERWLVTFDDGERAFAKVAASDLTADWLRLEQRAYSEIAGVFMPHMLGWTDRPVPALLLEDLSDATWPPPWDAGLVERVLATLAVVAATPCPDGAADLADQSAIFSGWSEIAADPTCFLDLQLVSPGWLEAALPALLEAQRPAELAGNALLHLDVRSDNICFTSDRTLLVDWNWIVRGNPLFDVAAWLPSLALEGGPLPEDVRTEAGVFASAIAGYLCAHAGLPAIPDAPRVRRIQRDQATTALPWAARWLRLPPPDGPAATRRPG